jgi:hypothetical protein
MGVAADFSKHLHRELQAYAAWLPVANNFVLGDYGVISEGVFQRLGNIAEFDVAFQAGDSDAANLNLSSEGARKVNLVGDAEVNALPDQPIDARVRIEFAQKDSYYVTTADTTAIEILDIRKVADALAKRSKAIGFRRKYRVVWSTVTGHNCLIVTSLSDNAAFELGGKADALRQLGVGAVDANLEITKDDNVGLTMVGKTGVVGLRLFKLKWVGGAPQLLAQDGDEEAVEVENADELENDV